MYSSITFNWTESLTHTYEEFATQFIAFAPQLIAAISLLIAGWAIAHGLRIITKKIVGSFDSLFHSVSKTDGARQEKMKSSYATIISKTVFWTVVIFFIAATTNMLGWKMFSNWMSNVIDYLPNLITGLLIILGGFLLGNGARVGVISAAHSAGMDHVEMLARVVQIVILFTTIIIGVEQIGVNLYFLTNILIVVLGVLLAGGALAFGLGSKTLIANIIGAQYIRKHCRIGEQMQIGNVVGNVVEVTQTSIILDTESGRAVIPAKYFQEQVSSFVSNIEESTKSEEKNEQ
jgi:hypothetical protein